MSEKVFAAYAAKLHIGLQVFACFQKQWIALIDWYAFFYHQDHIVLTYNLNVKSQIAYVD